MELKSVIDLNTKLFMIIRSNGLLKTDTETKEMW